VARLTRPTTLQGPSSSNGQAGHGDRQIQPSPPRKANNPAENPERRSTEINRWIRAEFLSTAPERAGLAEVVDDPLMVEPLSRSRLPEVIERPAQRAGLDFAPGLVERMVEETTGGDALPLLAYTLRELYQRAGPDGTVSTTEEGVLEPSRILDPFWGVVVP